MPGRDLTYLSLFSGIGGLDLAVEAFGFRCVGQVELDTACSAVLRRWWPTVPRWGDVRTFEAAETPSLVIGGYPCQPFSKAGQRRGTTDPRHLWPHFARVLGELRPRWALLENVPGHLSLGGAAVVGELAALGYDARWTVVRASDVGAPHRRERWFCLAERADADGLGLALGGIEGGTFGDQGEPQPVARLLDTVAADAVSVGRERGGSVGRGLARSQDGGWGAYAEAIGRWEVVRGPAPKVTDDQGRLAAPFVEWMMGFPSGWVEGMSRDAAIKALGNAVVPQQAVWALELLT